MFGWKNEGEIILPVKKRLQWKLYFMGGEEGLGAISFSISWKDYSALWD